jgi:hypothetical protein
MSMAFKSSDIACIPINMPEVNGLRRCQLRNRVFFLFDRIPAWMDGWMDGNFFFFLSTT